MDNRETVIRVNHVSKDFILPHEQHNTLKSRFTRLFNPQGGATVQHALDDIDFEVKKGEFFGIVGRNGSGKSTLLKIIAQIYQPTTGSTEVHGRLVPFIELGVGFNPDLSGRDNVYLNGAILGFDRKHVERNYKRIVEFAELEEFMDQKLKNYSSGMQVRLAFACATMAQAEILIVDEVLAVGDAEFQRKCFDYFDQLKGEGKTMVFVSHNMESVRRYCDRALLIENSKVVDIGDTDKIATMYSKLFLHTSPTTSASWRKGGLSPSGQERWGDGQLRFTEIRTEQVGKKNEEATAVKIITRGVAEQATDRPVAGFSVKNAKFQQLIGTNTNRRRLKLKPLSAGEHFEYAWTLPNIFNAGKYYVDCTISHDQADRVGDRWPEAAEFNIERIEENPYPLYSNDITFTAADSRKASK